MSDDGCLVFRERASTRRCPSEGRLRGWVSATMAETEARTPLALTVRFVDEEEGRRLNREYRGKDYATNVLSFPASLPDLPEESRADDAGSEPQAHYIGDLVLCVPVAERESRTQRKQRDAHIAHLVVHGVLHLLGYDHENTVEADEMEALEVAILAKLGLPDPYQTD